MYRAKQKNSDNKPLRLADTLEGVALQTLAPMLEREQALIAAEQIASEFLERCYGQHVYVHSRSAIERRRRDKYIVEHHNGTTESVRWLAQLFGIHEVHVYRILARMRGRERADRR